MTGTAGRKRALRLLCAVLLSSPGACGGETTSSASGVGGSNATDAGASGDAGVGSSAGAAGRGGEAGQLPDGGASGAAGCEASRAPLRVRRQPVDVILVVDNSGSMWDRCGAVEASLNESLAEVLDAYGIDYRVILISRHRFGPRTTGESVANTSLCIAAPLSGAATCPVPVPVFAERFFHYPFKIESFDALNSILETYDMPPTGDPGLVALAPLGYSPWLREAATKAFVLFTDDDEGAPGDEAPLRADEFLQRLSARSPRQFGTPDAPNFSFHSVVGLRQKARAEEAYLPNEPLESQTCTSSATPIPAAGLTYQILSKATGGVRFPICMLSSFDVAFEAIARQATAQARVTCDFAIPTPPGDRALDGYRVSVELGAEPAREPLSEVQSAAHCAASSYYVQAERIVLCPEACERVQRDPGQDLEVSFTCE